MKERGTHLGTVQTIVLLILCLVWPAPGLAGEENGAGSSKSLPSSGKAYNRLIHEKSPYLQQHAHNPVNWYPWGEEAFAAARAQNKPIFLSIGYSTCHWCHVMEKESFENPEVAKLLNAGYICIKVDREELPDVDHLYMSVVQAMTGRGGWPMTLVLTPDLVPFFGGTYFPRNDLIKIVTTLRTAWEKEPEKVQAIGREVRKFIDSRPKISSGNIVLDEEIFKKTYRGFSKTFDPETGGFGRAPKFPPNMKLKVLLRIARRTGNKHALEMVESTLKHMARGGIHDHVGGGFHRYSTDRVWLVPHFEKMLYDQASLSMVYLEAFQATGNEFYESVARGILDYVLRDMTAKSGGFFSAEDADSAGREGAFYVWSLDELKKILTAKELDHVVKIYGVTAEGNFGDGEKGENILNLREKFPWKVKNGPLAKSLQRKLFAVREKRVHPFKDDKILTAWNGLMIASMAKAYQVLGDPRYLAAAQGAARFIKDHLYRKKALIRRYRLGEAMHPASLDDYAYLIQSLLTLYEADFDEGWIQWARRLQETQDRRFWDAEAGGYFLGAKNGNHLLARKKEFADGARPNSNAVSVLNLLRLYDFTFDKEYEKKAKKVLAVVANPLSRFPGAFSQMLIALDYYLDRSKEIAVLGPRDSADKKAILQMLRTRFIPNKVLAYSPPNAKTLLPILEDKMTAKGKTTVFVCENNVCKYPTGNIGKVRELAENYKSYSLN